MTGRVLRSLAAWLAAALSCTVASKFKKVPITPRQSPVYASDASSFVTTRSLAAAVPSVKLTFVLVNVAVTRFVYGPAWRSTGYLIVASPAALIATGSPNAMPPTRNCTVPVSAEPASEAGLTSALKTDESLYCAAGTVSETEVAFGVIVKLAVL